MKQQILHQTLVHDMQIEVNKGKQEGGSPVLAEALLRDAVRERATDVHLLPANNGSAFVRFRIDGAILDAALLSRIEADHLKNQLKVLGKLDPTPAQKPAFARWTANLQARQVDVRLTVLLALGGEILTLRLLDPQRGLASDLPNLPAHLDPLLEHLLLREGMLLVVGPTASGKTTTAYYLMRRLAEESCNIVAIEDPPEYQISGVTQIAVDEEHGVSFVEGIHAALRLDPDYLLVGELRDKASARAALDAATTGCVVFGTLHARDAVGVLTSLRKWDADQYELSTLLSAIVSQRLVRRLCTQCRREDAPNEEETIWFELIDWPTPKKIWRAVGCRACSNVGYLGQLAIFETWILDESDRGKIFSHADERGVRNHLAGRSHNFLLADALKKVATGQTDLSNIHRMGGLGPGLAAMKASNDRNPADPTAKILA